jgi:1-acyl-sn-glycerol-3-phosphate acyltransferase
MPAKGGEGLDSGYNFRRRRYPEKPDPDRFARLHAARMSMHWYQNFGNADAQRAAGIDSVFQSRMMMHSIKSGCRQARNSLILLFGLALLGSLLLAGTAVLIVRSAPAGAQKRRQLARRAISSVFACYFSILSLLNILHLDLSEIDALGLERSLILAANHPSLLDALLIASRLSNVVCVMKAQVPGNILLGYGARAAGYIPNVSVRQIVSMATRELQDGSHVLLFPEGGRTRAYAQGGALNALQGTVAVIARRAGASVQTVLIESDSGFLGKGWPLHRAPDFPLTLRVRLGRRFLPPHDARRFVAELQTYFQQELTVKPLPQTQRLAA